MFLKPVSLFWTLKVALWTGRTSGWRYIMRRASLWRGSRLTSRGVPCSTATPTKSSKCPPTTEYETFTLTSGVRREKWWVQRSCQRGSAWTADNNRTSRVVDWSVNGVIWLVGIQNIWEKGRKDFCICVFWIEGTPGENGCPVLFTADLDIGTICKVFPASLPPPGIRPPLGSEAGGVCPALLPVS